MPIFTGSCGSFARHAGRRFLGTLLFALVALNGFVAPVHSAPIRVEVLLQQPRTTGGALSWDHGVNNLSNPCWACHSSVDLAGAAGKVSTPQVSGNIEATTVRFRMYGDTSHVKPFGQHDSDVLPAGSVGTAAGWLLYPGRTTLQTTLSTETPFAGATSVSGGQYHTCSVKSDGTVWCWGANGSGQLGNGTTTDSAVPTQVSNLAGAVAVSGGLAHACAALSQGTAWCWGQNGSGQLGNNTTANSSAPVQVSGISGVVAISAGGAHTCAVKSDRTVWCWGDNGSGQLGNGTTMSSQVPIQVPSLSDVVAVSAGLWFDTCAVKSDGTAWCWGRNYQGQLGDGTLTDSPVPVQVSLLTNVTAISTGLGVTCAITADTTASCWGDYLWISQVPRPIANLTGLSTISAGDAAACALKDDGTAWCWGANVAGELGNGTTQLYLDPVQVSNLSGATSLSVSYRSACAVESDGKVYCWGDNSTGQLGRQSNLGDQTVPGVVRASIVQGQPFSAAVDPSFGAFASIDASHHAAGIGSGWPAAPAPTWPAGIIADALAGSYSQTTLEPWTSQVDSYCLGLQGSSVLPVPNLTAGAGYSWMLPATSSGGGPITYTSITPSICTVTGTTASFSATGACAVQATTACTGPGLGPISGYLISNDKFPDGLYAATGPAIPLVGGGTSTLLLEDQSPSNFFTPSSSRSSGTFTATPLTVLSGSAYGSATGTAGASTLDVKGSFVFGLAGKPFDPAADDFVFGVGPFTAIVPAGSMTASAANYSFQGTLSGATVSVAVDATDAPSYRFSILAQGINMGVSPGSATSLELYAGDNGGSINVLQARTVTLKLLGSNGGGDDDNYEVAILSDPTFNSPSEVLASSLRFGKTGMEAAAKRCGARDVNRDGLQDLVCSFPRRATGLTRGSTQASLTGTLNSGTAITGVTAINTRPR